jgi:lipopolysaccharide biosynthesis glycosyltransferase
VNGVNVVQDDYYLATAADIVADPSAPGAFVQGIMENKEWVWNNGILVEQDVAAWKQELIKTKRIELAEKKASIFKDFLNKL